MYFLNHSALPVPNLTTAASSPLNDLEAKIVHLMPLIEAWFRSKWQHLESPVTTSVDLRNAGFKLAPVDTNLFPAGFNNLNKALLPLCIQAMQSFISHLHPPCLRVLLIPENHTRNPFYLQSLSILKQIIAQAGYEVRLGSLDETLTAPKEIETLEGEVLHIEPLIRKKNHIGLHNFNPCIILLNNDLSAGIPEILAQSDQLIRPLPDLGWAKRLKSTHFSYYDKLAKTFCDEFKLDHWLINPYFKAIADVDFMAQEGLDALGLAVDEVLAQISAKYQHYGIKHKPFVVVKSDNGTYGMSVMMVHEGTQIKAMNRKARTKMSSGKGSQKVNRVIIQEGVYTFESMPNGAVAEPVVYMIGPYVVGGFYRVHQGRGVDENLNAPGMHFEPLAFASPCNMPFQNQEPNNQPNRFYVYGVIARLAALAAAHEQEALKL